MDLNSYIQLKEAYSSVSRQTLSESAIDMPPANAPSASDPDPTKPFPKDREARAKAQAPKSTAPVKKEETELDTFDIILEYLIGRGFPQEDAIQLMATMDEEKRTKILGEAMHKSKEEAKHDEKLAEKDEEEAEYDTKKGKGKRAKELDDDAKQDDADAAEDVKNEAVSWDKYGRPKDPKKRAEAQRKAMDMRARDKAAGRRPYGSKVGYDKKEWDE